MEAEAPLDVGRLLEQKVDFRRSRRRSDVRHRFRDLVFLDRINLDTVVSRPRNVSFRIVEENGRTGVQLPRSFIPLPPFLKPSLRPILRESRFAVREIGGLISDQGRIDLTRRFVQHGFLEVQSFGGGP